MPKKMTDGLPMFGDAGRFVALPTWLAAGMSLAAAGVAATRGPGALAVAAVLAPMVWAFGRLHRHAPSADTTSDLVAQVLGIRAGVFTGLLQLVGYLLLGAGFAEGVGLAVPLWFTGDVDAVHAGSWWPACSLAAVILAAALTYFCRTWIVVCIAAVLGVAGVLVYFYIALAIAARAAAGSVSQSVNAAMTSQPPLATAALLTTLGLALLGVEAVTTLSDRVSSVSRPMGLAIAVIALCATTGWVAVARASSAVGLAFDESWIVLLNADFFDSAGSYWLVSGSLAVGSAALLAITLAAVRVAARLTQQITSRQHVGAVTIGAASVMSLLVIVVTQDWGGAGSKLVLVAPLLLLMVYIAVAEANSRLPGSGEAAVAVRVLMPALTVLIVLVLLQYYDFDATLLWSIALAAVAAAGAAMTAFRMSDDPSPSRQRLT